MSIIYMHTYIQITVIQGKKEKEGNDAATTKHTNETFSWESNPTLDPNIKFVFDSTVVLETSEDTMV